MIHDESAKANYTTIVSARQRAQRALNIYRACFVVSLVGLSTLATLFRHRENSEATLLLQSTTAVGQRRLGVTASLNFNPNNAREYRRQRLFQKNEEKVKDEVEALNNNATREVYFLNNTQLSMKDGFSASWLQTRADFMDMQFERIQICEDAAFRAYDKSRRPKMRMTLDWLDLGLEHMSKWWKTLKWTNDDPIPYNKATSQFKKYMNASVHYPVEASPIFHETLAVIAFQSFHNGKFPERAQNLTYLSLAATVESLRRAGFGRVTVGIMVESDFDLIQDAFKVLLDMVEPENTHDSKDIVTQIGHMEVGYALVSAEHAKTKKLSKNMPLGVLLGLKNAFAASELPDSNRTVQTTENMAMWIGNKQEPSYWKYVYLTEPDSILHTRPSTLAGLKAEVDKGSVLLPHRLQTMPHESDVVGMDKHKNLFLIQEEFPEVMNLDPINNHDACCDEKAGRDFKPGLPPYFDTCGQFWYACGFGRKLRGNEKRHERLTPYKLMRLSGTGTGLVSLAGSEQGRRCIPKKNGICRPAS